MEYPFCEPNKPLMFLASTVHQEIGLFNSFIIINSQLALVSKMIFLRINKEKILDSIHGWKCHMMGKTTLYYKITFSHSLIQNYIFWVGSADKLGWPVQTKSKPKPRQVVARLN
jgi:hypothetical protein